jgi:hypothetical protein
MSDERMIFATNPAANFDPALERTSAASGVRAGCTAFRMSPPPHLGHVRSANHDGRSAAVVKDHGVYATEMFRSLFRPQCDDGIHTRGAPRRDIAGEHRHRKHHGGHPGERGDVQTLNVEQ